MPMLTPPGSWRDAGYLPEHHPETVRPREADALGDLIQRKITGREQFLRPENALAADLLEWSACKRGSEQAFEAATWHAGGLRILRSYTDRRAMVWSGNLFTRYQ